MALDQKAETSPAGKAPTQASAARRRIPMSVPMLRLQVPPMEGFHLYWFRDDNVARAIEGGYEFVDWKEVPVAQRNVGAPAGVDGSTDLGSRVSVVGGARADGQPERLYLMKIREEWYQEDQKAIAERNAQILGGIFRGERIMGEAASSEDRAQAYVDGERTSASVAGRKPLFLRPKRKVQE